MAQDPHYDSMGRYHADPNWRRYSSDPQDIALPADPSDISLTADPRLDTNRLPESTSTIAGLSGRSFPRQLTDDGSSADGSDYGTTRPAAPSPLDALHTLLSGGAAAEQVKPIPFTPSRRNSAITGAIAKRYGLTDNGSMSQDDLEALDQFVRGGNVAEKLGADIPEIREKSAGEMAVQGARGQNALDVENLRGQYGLQGDVLKNQGATDVARIKEGPFASGDAGGGSNSIIDNWARQAMSDSSLLAKLPASAKEAVAARMGQMGGDIATPTNQTKQMSEAANDLLPMIDAVQQRAQALQSKGAFDLVGSPLRQFLVKHGAGSVLGYMNADPSLADEAGRFETDLGLLQSGVARAHAGARGAGNTGMAERFEKLMGAQGDLPTFLGQLQGVRDLLNIYARHTNPGIGTTGADPYADPNYQPR